MGQLSLNPTWTIKGSREPLNALRRADVVVVHQLDMVYKLTFSFFLVLFFIFL